MHDNSFLCCSSITCMLLRHHPSRHEMRAVGHLPSLSIYSSRGKSWSCWLSLRQPTIQKYLSFTYQVLNMYSGRAASPIQSNHDNNNDWIMRWGYLSLSVKVWRTWTSVQNRRLCRSTVVYRFVIFKIKFITNHDQEYQVQANLSDFGQSRFSRVLWWGLPQSLQGTLPIP